MSSAPGSQSAAPTSPSETPTSSPGTSISSQSLSSPSPNSSTDNSSTHSPDTSSATQPTTTNVPTTSNTPATSATPTTTPQSSPADQSTSAATRTTASQSVSASSTPTAAAATTSTSSFTSQVATTLLSTDAAGSIVYLTTSVPEVITTSISSSPSTSSNSNTGVIVGAVVGGVAGITILALLLFCIRKRVRKDEFDGNFDPDRVVGRADGGGGTLPRVDLAEEVTPFPQSYTDQGSSSMRQYGESPYIGVPSSLAASGQTSPELYSSVDAQSRQFMQHGLPPAGTYVSPPNTYGSTGEWHNPRPAASPPSTASYNTSSTRGAKEREALGRSGQAQTLGLATQPETAEGSDVVVHRDGGRAPIEDHPPPKEIPPAYESIPQD